LHSTAMHVNSVGAKTKPTSPLTTKTPAVTGV
jgi:hypothetical protein